MYSTIGLRAQWVEDYVFLVWHKTIHVWRR